MPKLTIQLKRLGKKRVKSIDYELPEVRTLRELLRAVVEREVTKFNERRVAETLLPFLTPVGIQEQSTTGKVGFGEVSNRRMADPETSVEAALTGFQDGLFLVFHDDEELKDLDATVHLRHGSTLAFLRMTFLTGTYW